MNKTYTVILSFEDGEPMHMDTYEAGSPLHAAQMASEPFLDLAAPGAEEVSWASPTDTRVIADTIVIRGDHEEIVVAPAKTGHGDDHYNTFDPFSYSKETP
jgi:hypothetical protein